MKTNYFTKVENKYVFNISLIFWHLFILLSTLAIIVSFVVFLWGSLPTRKEKVEKEAYPAKEKYPDPVKVTLAELTLEEVKNIEIKQEPQISEPVKKKDTTQVNEDIKGKAAYELSLNTLKTLIPPNKYSWEDSGEWFYTDIRKWNLYKKDQYRQWIITEYGLLHKLDISYQKSKATNFILKKQVLDGYLSIVKLLPEVKRMEAINYLIDYIPENVNQAVASFTAISKVIPAYQKSGSIDYINEFASLAFYNPEKGPELIEYYGSIIGKFNASMQSVITGALINNYYRKFDRNIEKQKEATNLLLPLLPQIKPDLQPKALYKYYDVYLAKNVERDQIIYQIENEYEFKVQQIESKYLEKELDALAKYESKKSVKKEYRDNALLGIGGGIVLIVLIGTILVFLSIQRSVTRIEQKIAVNENNQVPAFDYMDSKN